MIRIRTIASCTLALLTAGPVAQAQVVAEVGISGIDRSVLAMGTTLRLNVRGGGAVALEAALKEVARIEGACSTWNPDSPWSRMNGAQGASVPLDGEWIDLLATAKQWSARTGGAFDPALRTLMEAWDIRGRGRAPSSTELGRALGASGARHLHLDRENRTAHFDHPAAGIEEGGFLKGYALDRAAQALSPTKTTEGWMDFGGQVLVIGERLVAIADPQDRQRPRVSLVLRDASLSTSGVSERGRHILDPRTGRPCAAWGSASVVMASALEADILSTALYVMGPAKGLDWATAHHIPACFLLTDGRTRMTREFKALVIHKENQ